MITMIVTLPPPLCRIATTYPYPPSQDKQAEEEYQAWLLENWKADAARKGITDPTGLANFIKGSQSTEEKRVSKLGGGPNWQLAYKTHLRDKQLKKDKQVRILNL